MKKVAKPNAKKKAARRSTRAFDDIWPQERDFLERPERLRYVRRVVQPEDCVFCDALELGGPSFESLILWASDLAMVVMNKYPYNTGHVLVLPRRHVGDLREVSDEEHMAISRAIKASAEILLKVYSCPGLNIGLNHGQVAGAGIPQHLHWHLIPRWLGDTNFFPLIAETKVLPETLEQAYNRLKGAFKSLK